MISNRTLPENFSPFTAIQLNSTLVRLDWLKPSLRPDITSGTFFLGYKLYRNSTLLNRNLIESFTSTYFDLTNEFLPNQIYEYKILASNASLTSSTSGNDFYVSNDDEFSLKTFIKIKNEPPVMVNPPKLAKLTEKSALLDAKDCVLVKSPPTQPIIEYRFYVYELLVYRGLQTQFELVDLKPFTTYSIALEACTYLPGKEKNRN